MAKGKTRKGQTIQWPKEKGNTIIYKTLHRKLKFVHDKLQTRGDVVAPAKGQFLHHEWHSSCLASLSICFQDLGTAMSVGLAFTYTIDVYKY